MQVQASETVVAQPMTKFFIDAQGTIQEGQAVQDADPSFWVVDRPDGTQERLRHDSECFDTRADAAQIARQLRCRWSA